MFQFLLQCSASIYSYNVYADAKPMSVSLIIRQQNEKKSSNAED